MNITWKNYMSYRMVTKPQERLAIVEFLKSKEINTNELDEAFVFAAFHKNKIIGTIVLDTEGSNAVIRSFYVVEDMRSKGIGKKLLKKAQIFAAFQGVGRIYLRTESADFYFYKHGFKPLGNSDIPYNILSNDHLQKNCCPCARSLSKTLPDPWPYNPIR